MSENIGHRIYRTQRSILIDVGIIGSIHFANLKQKLLLKILIQQQLN